MKRILARIFIGILAVIAAFVLLLAGSVLVDAALGRDRILQFSNTAIPGLDGGPEVRAYVARPEGDGPFPAVIMIHEFYGLNESIIGKAQGLAEEGYLVIAPDTFRGSTTAWIPRAIYQVISTPPERVNQDLDAVFMWLADQPDAAINHVGVMGFCYGGRASLSYSLHNPHIAATVVFYGSPETNPEALAKLRGPVLGIFGGADSSIPLAEVRAFEQGLNQAGIPHEITVYPDQPHAFVTDMDAIRAGGVQAQAWEQMLRFFETHLKENPSASGPAAVGEYRQPLAWGYYLRLVYEHVFGMRLHAH